MSKILKLADAQNYFSSFSETNGKSAAHINKNELLDFLQENKEFGLQVLFSECEDIRKGVERLENGEVVKTTPIEVRFEDVLKQYYQTDTNSFLLSLGFNPYIDKAPKLARLLGHDGFSFSDALSALTETLSFSKGINNPYAYSRGVIGEIWLDVVRRSAYESDLLRWVSGSQNEDTPTITAHVHRRIKNSMGKTSEFETPKTTTYEYATKQITLKKHSGKIVLSEELLMFSRFDEVAEFLRDASADLAFVQEKDAIDTLINGDVTGGSESAPLIGVANTTTGFTQADLSYALEFMKKNNTPVDFIIGSLGIVTRTNLDSNLTNASFKTLSQGTGKEVYSSVVPANQIILGSRRAMKHHKSGGVQMSNTNQTNSNGNTIVNVSAWSAFSITRRDARVIMDKTVAWVENTSTDFPAYMNTYTQISNA